MAHGTANYDIYVNTKSGKSIFVCSTSDPEKAIFLKQIMPLVFSDDAEFPKLKFIPKWLCDQAMKHLEQQKSLGTRPLTGYPYPGSLKDGDTELHFALQLIKESLSTDPKIAGTLERTQRELSKTDEKVISASVKNTHPTTDHIVAVACQQTLAHREFGLRPRHTDEAAASL